MTTRNEVAQLQLDMFDSDDVTLRTVLNDAHLPSLLPALAHLTGDLAILRPDLAPDTSPFAREPDGMTTEAREAARELAFIALRRLRDGVEVAAAEPTVDQIAEMLRFVTGPLATDAYVPLLLEELAVSGVDPGAPAWTMDELAPAARFRVAVIGAGMSGILAGIRLRQAGIPFTIFEKNGDVGGTWWENTYPGARVDSPNYLYSYSFAQRPAWPGWYSTQPVLLDYFRDCAEAFGVRQHIRFHSEVESARYDHQDSSWELVVRTAGGTESHRVQAVISSVGQLNRPLIPEIAGRTTFAGPAFHTARWDHRVDLRGKRVAVIGNGASGSQVVPFVAGQAGELLIFQRTPSWYQQVPGYHDPVSPGMKWLLRHVPHYARWYRFWLFWTEGDRNLPLATVDPGRAPGSESIGVENDRFREMLAADLVSLCQDRVDLASRIVPTYPPFSKRLLLDAGGWVETLRRPSVRLVSDAITELTPDGIVTADGSMHRVDVVIYATGFEASEFLAPIVVRGREGVDLREQWAGDPRAYLGMTLPAFPNFFLMYGPNTNLVVTGGSTIYFAECEIRYILGCLRLLLDGGHHAMEPRRDVHDAYNREIDAATMAMAWGVTAVNSWYRNGTGRISQCWPFSLLEFWRRTQRPDPGDYELR